MLEHDALQGKLRHAHLSRRPDHTHSLPDLQIQLILCSWPAQPQRCLQEPACSPSMQLHWTRPCRSSGCTWPAWGMRRSEESGAPGSAGMLSITVCVSTAITPTGMPAHSTPISRHCSLYLMHRLADPDESYGHRIGGRRHVHGNHAHWGACMHQPWLQADPWPLALACQGRLCIMASSDSYEGHL